VFANPEDELRAPGGEGEARREDVVELQEDRLGEPLLVDRYPTSTDGLRERGGFGGPSFLVLVRVHFRTRARRRLRESRGRLGASRGRLRESRVAAQVVVGRAVLGSRGDIADERADLL